MVLHAMMLKRDNRASLDDSYVWTFEYIFPLDTAAFFLLTRLFACLLTVIQIKKILFMLRIQTESILVDFICCQVIFNIKMLCNITYV